MKIKLVFIIALLVGTAIFGSFLALSSFSAKQLDKVSSEQHSASVEITLADFITRYIAGHYTQAYRIMTDSMEPTLSKGDKVFFDKRAFKNAGPRMNDIVVFKETSDSKSYVSRIMGLPGDPVMINGTAVKVPLDHYYVRRDKEMGDIPKFVARNDLIGKAAFRFWPVKRMGSIKN